MRRSWSELADKGASAAKGATTSLTRAAAQKLGDHSGENNASGRIAAILDLDGQQTTVRLESLVTAFVRAVRKEDQDLLEKDVIKAAARRQRWIGTACLPFGLVGVYVSSLYCEAALLCHVERLHRLGLSDQQLAAHLLTLWKVMPDYEKAYAAVLGTGPTTADHNRSRAREAVSGVGFNQRGEMSKVDALKFLWTYRRVVSTTVDADPGTTSPKNVPLPKGRVKAVFALCERQLGVR